MISLYPTIFTTSQADVTNMLNTWLAELFQLYFSSFEAGIAIAKNIIYER